MGFAYIIYRAIIKSLHMALNTEFRNIWRVPSDALC